MKKKYKLYYFDMEEMCLYIIAPNIKFARSMAWGEENCVDFVEGDYMELCSRLKYRKDMTENIGQKVLSDLSWGAVTDSEAGLRAGIYESLIEWDFTCYSCKEEFLGYSCYIKDSEMVCGSCS